MFGNQLRNLNQLSPADPALEWKLTGWSQNFAFFSSRSM
jgi:hypothetical protein